MLGVRAAYLGAVFALTLAACSGEKPAGTSNGEAAETAASEGGVPGMDASVQKEIEDTVNAFIPTAKDFGVRNFKIVYELEGQLDGTRTMWVEDYGARVGVEEDVVFGSLEEHKLTYWDGEKVHLKTNDDAVSSIGIRPIQTEPSSFSTSSDSDLELVGYERIGDKILVGKTCEHWKNPNLNYDGCRWKHIDLEFLTGAPGGDTIAQRTTATSFSEGGAIPNHIKGLAN